MLRKYKKKTNRILSVVLALMLMLSVCPVTAFTASEQSAAANVSDTSNGTEIVRVGYYLYDRYQEYDENTGLYSGYSYEFLMALQQYTSWKYEFVPCAFRPTVIILPQPKAMIS